MSPELWTRTLRHRTQILYLPDISFITQMLDIRPGSRVIECGTGSGSFSHSLARTVSPHGHLFTFEYHELRAQQARKEFDEHKLTPLVTITQRDVCKDGFGIEDRVEAVFLDLPAPWEAIPHAKRALNRSKLARICCFSPCIEQVQKTCISLREHGFFDIEMYECLTRNHCVYKHEEIRRFTLNSSDYRQDSDGVFCTKRSKNYESNANGNSDDATTRLVSRPHVEIKGHTSYLTFASILDLTDASPGVTSVATSQDLLSVDMSLDGAAAETSLDLASVSTSQDLAQSS